MVTDDKIQEYIDGRLSERDRTVVAAYLIAKPHRAGELQQDRLLDDVLRGLNQHILKEPVPEYLINALRTASRNSK
ncbi:MAG: anti-sigma factor family protein [Hyphomicrobiaceae bacterium]